MVDHLFTNVFFCDCKYISVSSFCITAGLQSILAAESAFTVDHTPPTRGHVYNGDTSGEDRQYQESSTSLCVNWAGFADPHTGLGRIVWAVSRVGGAADMARDLTAEEKMRGVACYEGLSLTHNTTYYSTLTVYNAAMDPLSVSVTSDGGKLVVSNGSWLGLVARGRAGRGLGLGLEGEGGGGGRELELRITTGMIVAYKGQTDTFGTVS